MVRFVTRPDSFNEVRNKMLAVLIPIFSGMLGCLLWIFSDSALAPTSLILILMVAAIFAFSILFTMQRLKKAHESFVLTVDSDGFLREQFGMSPIRILPNEITSIVRAYTGTIVVTGASRLNPIIIPAQIEDRHDLETILQAIKPIENKSSGGILVTLASIFALLILGWLFFGVDNKTISVIAGALLFVILASSLVLTFRNKNIETRLRKMMLIGVIPVLSIGAMLYFKIISPQGNQATLSLKASYFNSGITIYFLDDTQAMQKEEFKELIQSKLAIFRFVEEFPEPITNDVFVVDAPENIQTDYAPGDAEYLSGAGVDLTEIEIARLQTVQKGLYVQFVGTNDSIQKKQQRIAAFFDELASEKSLIILDENSRAYFNSASWKQHRVLELNTFPMNLPSQINIHTYREGELCRAVTLGMDKFSLPDISIKNFTCSDQRTMGKLINAIAQTMFENPWITSDSVLTVDITQLKNDSVRFYLTVLDQQLKQVAGVKLKSIEPEDGDAINRQLTVDFSASDGSLQEAQFALLKELFGRPDSLIYTTHDDLLLDASNRARARLPELKQMLNKGLEPGYSILVKAPFETNNGGREWMWVEVSNWRGKNIKGFLQSQPYNVSGLEAGAEVKVDEDDIFDYVLYKPDGSFEGNETEQYLH
jgi:uncharacterized protein YegJ (DUF2314 family)